MRKKHPQNLVYNAILLWLLTGCSYSYVAQTTPNQQYTLDSTFQVTDSHINSFIAPYRDSLEIIVKKVLAVSEKELTVGRPGRDLFPSQVALGNFMSDAILEIAKQKSKEQNKPQPMVALFTWGSFRKSLPSGPVTLRNVYELMPFENEMVVVKLTGAQLSHVLNQISGNFNPVSGVRMKQRDINSIWVNDQQLNNDASYYLVVSDYHAFGGDNLTVLTEASESFLCGIKVRDAIVLYLQQLTERNQTLKPDYEPRITK